MKTRLLAITLAAGLALLGAGCSDSSNPGPSTGDTGTPTGTPSPATDAFDTPDPCSLLTLAEISAELGEEFTVVQELPPGGLPGQRTCSYEKGAGSVGMVSVAAWPFDPAEVDAFILEIGEVDQFDDLGDRSFGEPNSLWIQAGNIMINVTLSFIEVENVDPILQLGLQAVSRL